jgi:hypothetical protein
MQCSQSCGYDGSFTCMTPRYLCDFQPRRAQVVRLCHKHEGCYREDCDKSSCDGKKLLAKSTNDQMTSRCYDDEIPAMCGLERSHYHNSIILIYK